MYSDIKQQISIMQKLQLHLHQPISPGCCLYYSTSELKVNTSRFSFLCLPRADSLFFVSLKLMCGGFSCQDTPKITG